MNGPIEPLAHQHDDECKCKERQSINMAQPQITGEKITHVRAKMLARQSAVQYRGPRVGRWIDCMRVTLWRNFIAIDIALRFPSGANRSEAAQGFDVCRMETFRKDLMKSESSIRMIAAVKHPRGPDRCEHRVPILKGM